MKRLQKDVLDHKPDLVTVMFGLNDIVRVPQPERPGELDGFANQMYALAKRMKARGLDVGNRRMADLGAELEGLAVRAKKASASDRRSG